MAPNITHAGGIITVDDYASGAPCTFEDVYDADVAGGWGVVSKMGTKMYSFQERLVIGDGTDDCYFTDTLAVVHFEAGTCTANGQNCIEVKDHGYMVLGSCSDVANHKTDDGCVITVANDPALSWYRIIYGHQWDSTTYMYCYSCVFIGQGKSITVFAHRMYNCFFTGSANEPSANDMFNVQSIGTWKGIFPSVYYVSVDKITAIGCYSAMRFYGNKDREVHNVYARGCTECLYNDGTTASHDLELFNVDSDTWDMNWSNSAGSTVYRKYDVDLNVVDEYGTAVEGAVVSLLDNADVELFSVSTDAAGDISTQIVTYCTYCQADGHTATLKGPHTLIINATGYKPYLAEITIDAVVNMSVGLRRDMAQSQHTSVKLFRSQV